MTEKKLKKPYHPPQLIEYGSLGTLIRGNPNPNGSFDGVAMKKGRFKTG